MKKAENRFRYIKKLINNSKDVKERIDMFYFNGKAINFVNKLQHRYMLNEYYDLQTIDILLMVDESKNIYEVQDKLYKDYETGYATSVWSNFVSCLEREI